MVSSVKKNFALNLINTISGLLFPLITFPYASRILLAEGIGQVQFFQGIIGYIALCTALGIPMYAIREIARVRNDRERCSRTSVEILLLHSGLTLIGYAIVAVLVATVTQIQVNIPLFLLLSTNLFFTAIGATWFYQGIEDFKYITIRAIVVRLFSLVCLFIFVKEKSDLFYYAAISVTAEVGSNLFNFFRLRKYIDFSRLRLKELHPLRHLKPALRIFAMNLVVSIYVNLDSVMLGFLKDETAVGYYAASTRLTKSILGVVQSLGTVLLPRISNLVSNHRMGEFHQLANKAFRFMLMLSLPLTVGLIFMASPLIHLFCGSGFEPSVLTTRIMAPIILFISLSGIMCWQILFPLDKEKWVVYATMSGAIINFTLNWILIPSYAQYGAGIATCIAECLVTIVAILLARKLAPVQLWNRRILDYVMGTLLMTLFLGGLTYFVTNEIRFAVIGVPVSILLYGSYLWFRKDEFVIQAQSIIINLLNKKKNG